MHTLDYANHIESLEGKPIFFLFCCFLVFRNFNEWNENNYKCKGNPKRHNNNVKICKECQSMRALDYANQTNSLFLFYFLLFSSFLEFWPSLGGIKPSAQQVIIGFVEINLGLRLFLESKQSFPCKIFLKCVFFPNCYFKMNL